MFKLNGNTQAHSSSVETAVPEGQTPARDRRKAGFGKRMSHKIPLIIQTASLVSCVAVGLLAHFQSADALREEANNKLLAMLESRQTAISGYLETIRQDLQFQAANPTLHQALRAFTAAWRELGENQTQTLQSLYIHDNPYPIGDKEKFDAAGDGSSYSRAHAMYHPFFRGFLKQRGYYDAFLFDPDGNLIYTVFKERDYATNLNRDEWRDTDLGKVFRAARENATASYQAFFDFMPYAPSNGTPAGFIATPVLDEAGRILGVLAFRMPIDRLNAVMQVSAGLGETGETYIVGVDFLMRSDSRFSDDSTILARRIDTTPVKAALDGATGVMEAGDYRGMDVFAGHAPLNFLGTRWAVIAEMDSDEVMAPVDALGIGVLISSAHVALIVAIFGQVAARKIVRPLTAMTAAMRALADGDKTVEVPSRGRSDEIGDMADAVEVFRQKAIKIEQMAVEQEAKDRETAAQKRQMMLDLAAQFEGGVKGIVETVSSASTEMQSTAQSMAATAAEAGRQTSAVAAASEEATTNVQTVAAAAEELSKSGRGDQPPGRRVDRHRPQGRRGGRPHQ